MSVKKEHKILAIRGVKLLHFMFSAGVFYLFWLLFRYNSVTGIHDVGFRYNYIITAGYCVLLSFFLRTYNGYLLGYSRIRSLVVAQFYSQTFSLAIVYFGASVGWNYFRNPSILLILLLIQYLFDVLWSYFACQLFFWRNPPKQTILIYGSDQAKLRFGSIYERPNERLFRICEELKYTGDSFSEIEPRLEGCEAVFAAGLNLNCRNEFLSYCKQNGIPGFFLPDVGDVIMQGAVHIQSFDSPVLYVSKTQLTPEFAFVKRSFDVICSILAIIVLSPVLLITAIAIKIDDRGPVLYRQVRLTKDGIPFEIMKFRSMRTDAEKDGVARLSSGECDPRITPVGRFLRKHRIDELPQLFNILKGDMSFVGPRPERPEIAEQYYQMIPEFRLRLEVKAGLTGYAQVYGRYNTDPYEKLEFDLLYINHMNILTDLRLIFATIGILFSSKSTEGVQPGSVTALGTCGEDEKETAAV